MTVLRQEGWVARIPEVVASASIPAVRPAWQHRISVDQYHRMIDAGVFDDDDRVELVDGFMVAMSPQDPSHAWAVSALTQGLTRQLPTGFRLRVQLPLTLATSEPEPDLAVV